MKEIESILESLSKQVSSRDLSDYEISYRGLEDCNYDNKPSLFRDKRYLDSERESIEEYCINFPENQFGMHTIDVLTQLQHYGCPTRMLDVSSNFLVALFFACGGWKRVKDKSSFDNLLNKDGVVRIFMVEKANVKSIDSESVNLVSNIARMSNDDDFGKLMWLCERDWGVWQSDDDLFQQNVKDVNKVFFVSTKLNNPRVRAQHGKFFLFGGLKSTTKDICRATKVSKSILEMPQEFILGDIVVPKEYKKSILNDLKKYFNISYSTLCPERSDIITTIMDID